MSTWISKWISWASTIADIAIDQQHRTKWISMVLQRTQWFVSIYAFAWMDWAFLFVCVCGANHCVPFGNFLISTSQVGGNTMSERAKKLKKHTKMHKNNAQFWLPVIYTSLILIQCYKNVKQIQHASDRLNVGLIWILQKKKTLTHVNSRYMFDCGLLSIFILDRWFGQCTEKRCSWSTIVVSYNIFYYMNLQFHSIQFKIKENWAIYLFKHLSIGLNPIYLFFHIYSDEDDEEDEDEDDEM